jgi:hypothetical protein
LRASSTTAIRGWNDWEAGFHYTNTNLGFYGGKLSEKKQIWGLSRGGENTTRRRGQFSLSFFLLTGSVFHNRLNWSSGKCFKKSGDVDQ